MDASRHFDAVCGIASRRRRPGLIVPLGLPSKPRRGLERSASAPRQQQRSDAGAVVVTSLTQGLCPCTPDLASARAYKPRVLEISVGAGAKPRGGEVFAGTSASDRCSLPSAGAAAAIRNAKPGLEPGAAVTRGHAKQTKSACEIPPIDGVGNWQSQFGRSGFGRFTVRRDRARAKFVDPARPQLKLMYWNSPGSSWFTPMLGGEIQPANLPGSRTWVIRL